MTLSVRLIAGLLVWCTFGVSALATEAAEVSAVATTPDGWRYSVVLSDTTLTRGVPISALDQDDWYQRVDLNAGNPRAVLKQEVLLELEHPSGWRLGASARAQAHVSSSSDAVRLAQDVDFKRFPDGDRSYWVDAQGAGWRGSGIRLGSPWWPVGHTGWELRGDLLGMTLHDWRESSLLGAAHFDAGNQGFDFDMAGERVGRRVRGPFLGQGGSAGYGWSLSLDVRAALAERWRLRVRAQDLVSRLHWNRIPTETLLLNSNVTQLRPDGFVDYGPVVRGQQALVSRSTTIGAGWHGELTWQVTPRWESSIVWERVAGLSQTWIGLGKRSSIPSGLSWRVASDMRRGVVKGRIDWGPAFVEIATDVRSANSEARHLQMGVALRR